MTPDNVVNIGMVAFAVIFIGVLIWYLPAGINPIKKIRPLRFIKLLFSKDGPFIPVNEASQSQINLTIRTADQA